MPLMIAPTLLRAGPNFGWNDLNGPCAGNCLMNLSVVSGTYTNPIEDLAPKSFCFFESLFQFRCDRNWTHKKKSLGILEPFCT